MYLTSVSVLLILWMTSRTAKYFIFWQPAAIRYLWYLFYLPMLFVPMLAVLIALSLGKPDGYRLPKSTWILWAVSGVLLLLVLTNDLHQLVFTFPADAAVWSDTDNGYAAGYFVVTGWQVLCAAALVTMFFKCHVPNGLLLHTMPVNGGYAVWTEDVSALLAVKEASESLAEELKERNALLRYEYKRDARRCMIEEQNRLYDLLQSATQRQIDRCRLIIIAADVHTLHTQTLIIGQKFDFGEIRFLLVCRLLYRPIKISFRYKIGQAYQRYPLEMFLVGIVDTLHTVLPPEALKRRHDIIKIALPSI